MIAQISFDLVMDDDMDFAEGAYRLPGRDWQVFIFSQHPPVEKFEINAKGCWASGVTGIFVRFPKAEKLNKVTVMRVLSEELGVTEWQEVKGPDSMQLR